VDVVGVRVGQGDAAGLVAQTLLVEWIDKPDEVNESFLKGVYIGRNFEPRRK
jgi:hypothetical protein